MSAHLWVSAAVEGDVDEAVLTKLAESCGISIRSVFGRMGKGAVCKRLDAYNRAAAHAPWIALLDGFLGCCLAAIGTSASESQSVRSKAGYLQTETDLLRTSA